ncbi:MAG: ATP-binding protein, partial [Desulfosarcinaceae bacterium]
LKKKFDFRHIRIERRYDPDMPQVPCAATEIEQVVLNLLRNAAQAMVEHGACRESPAITLRLYKNDKMAVIEVQDNGPGLSEQAMKRVFEPFYTTKDVGVGTGLGLSVSYFIVTNNHNGTMEVRSEPGRGANFIVCLPLAADGSVRGVSDADDFVNLKNKIK